LVLLAVYLICRARNNRLENLIFENPQKDPEIEIAHFDAKN
jgi:hypothetical protein